MTPGREGDTHRPDGDEPTSRTSPGRVPDTDSTDDHEREPQTAAGSDTDSTGDGGAGSRAGAGRDPGLQPERTRLAWRRTTLAYAVVAVLAVRVALHAGLSTVGILVCAVCAVLWSAFVWVAHRRIRTLATAARPPALAPRQAAAAVLCAVATAVCAVALVAR